MSFITGLLPSKWWKCFSCKWTCSYGLSQLISDPTHILQNSSSCIYLIFMNQPIFVIDSGVHPLLHPNCLHQVVFSKLNWKIEYPPLYEGLVWDYNNADFQSISKAIKMFNWEKLFQIKNIHDHLTFFNEAIVDIVSNYIPNKCITWNDEDSPWSNDPP